MALRVFISCPYRGDVEANMAKAGEYAMRALELGYHPVVPHHAFHYLADKPNGEIIALYLCCREIETCDEVWIFGKHTDGMAFECAYARGIGVPIFDGFEREW